MLGQVVQGNKYVLHQADNHDHVRIRDGQGVIAGLVPNDTVVEALQQEGSKVQIKVAIDTASGECLLYGWVEMRNVRKLGHRPRSDAAPASTRPRTAE